MPAPDVSKPYDQTALTHAIKEHARSEGFVLAGVCPAVAPPGLARFQAWLAAGMAGTMHYFDSRRAAYEHPSHVLAGARSMVILALPYASSDPADIEPGQGRVARYAWNADYHLVVRARLNRLVQALKHLYPSAQARGVVDTAPLLEREFAQMAGLGWVGKNTLLLNRLWGSWFFLAVLLTDVELDYDEPFRSDHCGTCRACLDACPTQAFPQPYVLDARRCISYLTIELRGEIPTELRAGLGNWAFGCDICQEVCPWNRQVPPAASAEFAPVPDRDPLELAQLFTLEESAFRSRFRHTPLWRPRRRGMLRNAALVLGNQRHRQTVPALILGLSDSESVVRGACAWALGQMIEEPAAKRALAQRLAHETDQEVAGEIARALALAPEVPPC